MKTPQNKDDIAYLIKNKIQESFDLEYKDSRSLNTGDKKISEIAKDVSSMANSAGGIIVYGISEDGHYPTKITPIDPDQFSKEWLEQIITSNIFPKIDNLKINQINVEDGVVYAIKIPQSFEVHQNTRDYRYYKRRNFKIDPMLDYEIKDVMNRVRHPFIELEFEIVEQENYSNGFNSIGETQKMYDPDFILKIRAINKGIVYAKFINYFIEIPQILVCKEKYSHLKKIEGNKFEYYGDNTIRDQTQNILGFDPVLPSLYSRSENILLNKKNKFDDKPLIPDNTKIKWRVHADNAPAQEGYVMLNQVKIIKI